MTRKSQPIPSPVTLKRLQGIAWPWFVGALAFTLYAGTLSHDYALDDYYVILTSPQVQKGLKGIPEIWSRPSWYAGIQYRPLPSTMFAIERELGGGSPAPGHLVNVLLYAVACGFLTTLLLGLLGKERRWIAVAASLLFAAHPIHTEVVANIKSRDEILCLLSLLGTLACMRAYALAPGPFARRAGWIAAGVMVFAAGLFTKESALTFIVAVPLTIWFFTPATCRRLAEVTAVLLAAGAAYVTFAVFVVHSLAGYAADTPLNNALVAIPGIADRTATALSIIVKYLRLLVLPHPLVHDYGFSQIPTVDALSLHAAGVLAIVLGLLTFAIIRLRSRSVLAWGILFFAATIALSSNLFILIGATMGERFLFIPSLGFCVILASVLHRTRLRLRMPGRLAAVTLIAILLPCSLKTVSRNADWKDNLTLFSRDITHAPASATANTSLGNMLIIAGQSLRDSTARRGSFERAVRHLRAAIRIFPDYAYAEGNLGLAFDFLGDTDSAMVHFRTAFRLNPRDVIAAVNVAGVFARRGEYDSALAVLDTASARAPGDPNVREMRQRIQRTRLEASRQPATAVFSRESHLLEDPQ